MTPETEKVEIEMQISEVSNKFLRHISRTIDSVNYIFHAIKNYNPAVLLPLETDAIPLTIEDPFLKKKDKLLKDPKYTWLFKKAFEDIHIGLTESLVEAHKFSEMYSVATRSFNQPLPIKKEEIQKQIKEIEMKSSEMFFKRLITEIEQKSGIELQHKDEILSINQIRNCLIHANGKVSEKHINNNLENTLQLSYYDLIAIIEKDGNLIEMNLEHRNIGYQSENINLELRKRNVNFKIGEEIVLDQDIFNGVVYTCSIFVIQLLNIFKELGGKEKVDFQPTFTTPYSE